MKRKNAKDPDIALTKEQANTAIELCKRNAISFMNDAMQLWVNDQLEHIPVSLEYAMEELGKAKIIVDKLTQSADADTIRITRNTIYDHKAKLEAFIQMLRSAKEYHIITGAYFEDNERINQALNTQIKDQLEQYANEAIDQAKEGHKHRLRSAFVDFDPEKKNEPWVGHTLSKEALQNWNESLREVISVQFPND